MFKLGMSIILGVIAALVIILTGFLGDARLLTILGRALVGFLAAAAFTYLLTFILEMKNIVGFDKDIEPIEEDKDDEPKPVEEYEKEDSENEQDAEVVEDDDTKTADGAEPSEFKPLANSIRHMEKPPEN